MFGIGFPEMILILVLVVLIVGPEQLPDVIRKGMTFLREARRQLSDIKTAVNQQTDSFREPLESIQDSIKQDISDTEEKTGQFPEKSVKQGSKKN